jgi:hypothetical protein
VLNDAERRALRNAEKARIFRIVHRDNIRWILENGVHCSSSQKKDAAYVSIGHSDIIQMRTTRAVPIPPGGVLSDYVPFYFTPFSPMAYNIKTGFNGIRRRDNAEIVILVSSLPKLLEQEVPFVFADRHAWFAAASFFSDLADLNRIDWRILQAKDFRRDNDDLGKMERYQAEALVHRRVPISALAGIVCYNNSVVNAIQGLCEERDIQLTVLPKPAWYFA